MKRVVIVALMVLFLALPATATGSFIEYQDIPVYIDGTGWCIQRHVSSSWIDSQGVEHILNETFLIC